MSIVRTVDRVKMYRMRLWLVALALQASLAAVSCAKHHRRSMANQAALPVSKGGWRPVVGSGGLLYGPLGTAPLHAPSYKLPVLDLYPSSARPHVARDATKLTTIAQSYRPTTLRTIPAPAPTPANQPINSYLNPFALPNNGLSHYKFVQNFPVESVVFRNPHNPYSARPVIQKYQTKPKQQFQNNVYQQLTNIQPIQFGQYPTGKPLDIFGNPVEVYVRPDAAKRPQSADTEIFKPEVFKLPDNEVAPQSVSQQVKTAQQQTYVGTQKFPVNPNANYAFQDSISNYQQFPPSILGTFGSFGVQSVKAREPAYPTKTTYIPPQPTKQTIFNSFSYTPNFKSTPSLFATTTPKLLTTPNQFIFGSTLNDLRTVPTPQTKVTSPPKIDPNVGTKGPFKPSPQDPFAKNIHNFDYNKITTYNPPIIQSTTTPNTYYHDYDQYTGQQNYNSKPIVDYRYEIQNHRVNDNIGVNQHVSQQYANPPNGNLQLEGTNNFAPYKSTYEVTENESEDIITHSSPGVWAVTPASNNNQKTTEETITKQVNSDTSYGRTTTPTPELPEEYAIVTEAEKGYEISLNYDNQVESQSRRPLGDDFEPIGKHKLKDYYYKVSTPNYGEHSSPRRTKKPTEAPKTTQKDITTTTASTNKEVNELPVEALPTLPPNKHFKRPSNTEPIDKDRIRKRNKIRRRRPPLANGNRFQEENNTRKNIQSSTEETPVNTEPEEIHTIRPRVRPSKIRTESSLTTPTITTDLTTSALPTISPTTPTVLKKKLSHRKPLTTTADRPETTTQSFRDDELNKESPIMKIATRPQLSRNTYETKSSEVPDYSHKQDEKDTPTSDVAVSLSDTLKTTSEALKDFSFHRDVRPVEMTTTESLRDVNEYSNDGTTTARTDTTRNTSKSQRPRIKNKYDRPRFSVKDYRNRLSSTTSTTETPVETTKVRFPQRKIPYSENGYIVENETTTERKKFTPKDPRYKINRTENNEQTENVQSTRQPGRQRHTTVETESSTQKISSRIRNGQRRPRPTEETIEASSPPTVYNKRPLRKKIKDSEIGESVQDITVTETIVNDHRNDITSERSRSESAIMKIADKKHQDHLEHIFEHSKRVSDLTLAASKDYNTPGMFKTVAANSRRIPNYFTIATDDPILPIEAFFPQLNQKKES
ncbi:uncharacterized protein [Epargyreus clarus]|uniref:uncharacterized protein n=1 Tax=Epargyreus clarus TaxID=520877 RepID=UPI003C302347